MSCRSSILSVTRSWTLRWSLVLMFPVGWYTSLRWCKKLLLFSFLIVNSSPWAEVVDLFQFSLFIVYVLSSIYRLILQYFLLRSRYFKLKILFAFLTVFIQFSHIKPIRTTKKNTSCFVKILSFNKKGQNSLVAIRAVTESSRWSLSELGTREPRRQGAV